MSSGILLAVALSASHPAPAHDGDLSRRRELARLTNRYNGLVKDGPRRKPGPLGFVRYFFLDRHPVDGQIMSLWSLERRIRDFGEPRVHFALNCGARFCPPIRRYEGDRLGEQLDLATRAYLADPAGARLDAPDRTLYLSRLFLWYRRDFGDPLHFALRYLPPEIRDAAAAIPGLRVRYLPWSWETAAL